MADESATLTARNNDFVVARKSSHVFTLSWLAIYLQVLEGGFVKISKASQVNLHYPAYDPTQSRAVRNQNDVELEFPRINTAVRFFYSPRHTGHTYFWLGEGTTEALFDINVWDREVDIWANDVFAKMDRVGFVAVKSRPNLIRPKLYDLSEIFSFPFQPKLL
ncbi:MAG TPA: hypothetical protein VL306_02920 [Methylomirabilota bacterium]|nr:hypothetical protein [Methylomirabilota bacterium]